jgi:hypothetical protein
VNLPTNRGNRCSRSRDNQATRHRYQKVRKEHSSIQTNRSLKPMRRSFERIDHPSGLIGVSSEWMRYPSEQIDYTSGSISFPSE